MPKTHYKLKPSISVIIEKNGKILFVEEKRGDRISYNEPVGTVEPREPITKAAIREVKEETGYIIKLTGLIGIYQVIHKKNSRIDAIRFVFTGKIIKKSKRWKKEKNVTPLWIERSEISKYWNKITRPASRHALGDYLNREEKKKGDDISIYKINR